LDPDFTLFRPALLVCALAASVPASACRSAFASGQLGGRSSIPVERFRDDQTAYSSYSGFVDSSHVVLRDSVTWRRVWQRLNSPFIPPPPLPSVDFSREMVIVTAMGARPSAGYDVVIEGADLDSTGIEVAVRRTTPGRGCPVAAVITQPVDLARLPASERPVRFRERSVTTSCGAR
jgi:hypothetical protein